MWEPLSGPYSKPHTQRIDGICLARRSGCAISAVHFFLAIICLAHLEYTLILVTVRENEPFEKALRRFRRKVEREGIRKDIKKNSFYLKPGETRRLKQRLAEKRRRKSMHRSYKRE
jgi:small subunit ribosomal protein S21